MVAATTRQAWTYPAQDWAEVAALLERSGATPFVDMAYQGFGEGLDADAGGLRHLAARLPEVLIAASCSKNFGLYRDRVGIAMAVVPDAQRDAIGGDIGRAEPAKLLPFRPTMGAAWSAPFWAIRCCAPSG